MKKLLFTFSLFLLVTCVIAQDSSLLLKTQLLPITAQRLHGSQKTFFYGDKQITQRGELASYLFKFSSSAKEYKKSRNNQKAIYYIFGSVVLIEIPGLITIKKNYGLGRGLLLTSGAGLLTCFYLTIPRDKHRNRAIKLYNQNL